MAWAQIRLDFTARHSKILPLRATWDLTVVYGTDMRVKCCLLWLPCFAVVICVFFMACCACRRRHRDIHAGRGHRLVHAANTANANTLFATTNAIVYCYGTIMRAWSVLVLCICVYFMDVSSRLSLLGRGILVAMGTTRPSATHRLIGHNGPIRRLKHTMLYIPLHLILHHWPIILGDHSWRNSF